MCLTEAECELQKSWLNKAGFQDLALGLSCSAPFAPPLIKSYKTFKKVFGELDELLYLCYLNLAQRGLAVVIRQTTF